MPPGVVQSSGRPKMSRPLPSSSPDVPDPFVTPKKSTKVSTDKVTKSSTRKKQSRGGNRETPTKGATGRLAKLKLDSPGPSFSTGSSFESKFGSRFNKRNIIYVEADNYDDDEEEWAYSGYGTDESSDEGDEEDDSRMQVDGLVKTEEDLSMVGPDHPSIPKSLSNMEMFRRKPKGVPKVNDPNGRKKGRRLVMWHRDRMMEKLLLNLQYESHVAGIKLPWDAAIQRLNPGSGGPAAVQMLNKVRDQLIMEGHMIPPTMGKGQLYHESVRGFIRDVNGPTVTTTKAVRWSDRCDNRKHSLQDHGMVRGSGKYRQVDLAGMTRTKVPRTQADRGGPRNLIPSELLEEMLELKTIKKEKPNVVKRGPYNMKPRVVKSEKFVDDEDDEESIVVKPVTKRGPYNMKPSRVKSRMYAISDNDEDDDFVDGDSDGDYQPSGKQKGRKNKARVVTLADELIKAEFEAETPQSSFNAMRIGSKHETLLVKLKLAPRNLAKFPSDLALEAADNDEDSDYEDTVLEVREDRVRGRLVSELIRRPAEPMPSMRAPPSISSSQSSGGYLTNEHDQLTSPASQANNYAVRASTSVGYSDVGYGGMNYQPVAPTQNSYAQDATQAPPRGAHHEVDDDQAWEDFVDEPMADGANMDDGYAITFDSRNPGHLRQFVFDAQPQDIQSDSGNQAEAQPSIFEGATHDDPYNSRNPNGHFIHAQGQIYDDSANAAYDEYMASGAYSPINEIIRNQLADHLDAYGHYMEDYNENSEHSGRTIQEPGRQNESTGYFDDGGGFDF